MNVWISDVGAQILAIINGILDGIDARTWGVLNHQHGCQTRRVARQGDEDKESQRKAEYLPNRSTLLDLISTQKGHNRTVA